MSDYREMVKSYEESIGLLKGRIDELTVQIGRHKAGGGETLNKLIKRRYKLYQEIWELQACLRMIWEYIDAVEEREGSGAEIGA